MGKSIKESELLTIIAWITGTNSGSNINKIVADSIFNQFNLCFQAKFLHDMIFMRFNRTNAYKKTIGDFLIDKSFGKHF